VLLDRLAGEPTVQPHPVEVLGSMLGALEERLWRDDRVAGMVHAALGTALGALAGAAVRSTALATWLAVSGRMLGDTARDVARALDGERLDDARGVLPALVGRDTAQLDRTEICRAAVESIAENTVDAVVAPALWASLLGAPGALGHRAVDTLDSMVGHRTPRCARFGWASARLDDAAAWVPARATAVLVAAVRPSAAGDVVRAVRRDAPAHPSPNAGVAEAAFAAALDLQLGGPTAYGGAVEERPLLGSGRPPAPPDVVAAAELSRDVSLALAAALGAAGALRLLRTRP
jgi:adenosylcobinamide-phosphate synthase